MGDERQEEPGGKERREMKEKFSMTDGDDNTVVVLVRVCVRYSWCVRGCVWNDCLAKLKQKKTY